jgi:hypothetical protein
VFEPKEKGEAPRQAKQPQRQQSSGFDDMDSLIPF